MTELDHLLKEMQNYLQFLIEQHKALEFESNEPVWNGKIMGVETCISMVQKRVDFLRFIPPSPLPSGPLDNVWKSTESPYQSGPNRYTQMYRSREAFIKQYPLTPAECFNPAVIPTVESKSEV